MATRVTRVAKIEPQQPETVQQKPYRANYALIGLFIGGLFCLFFVPLVMVVILPLSVYTVYRDAKTIHAGSAQGTRSVGILEKFQTINHTPGAWAVGTLFVWLIALPIYLCKRKTIFRANA